MDIMKDLLSVNRYVSDYAARAHEGRQIPVNPAFVHNNDNRR